MKFNFLSIGEKIKKGPRVRGSGGSRVTTYFLIYFSTLKLPVTIHDALFLSLVLHSTLEPWDPFRRSRFVFGEPFIKPFFTVASF